MTYALRTSTLQRIFIVIAVISLLLCIFFFSPLSFDCTFIGLAASRKTGDRQKMELHTVYLSIICCSYRLFLLFFFIFYAEKTEKQKWAKRTNKQKLIHSILLIFFVNLVGESVFRQNCIYTYRDIDVQFWKKPIVWIRITINNLLLFFLFLLSFLFVYDYEEDLNVHWLRCTQGKWLVRAIFIIFWPLLFNCICVHGCEYLVYECFRLTNFRLSVIYYNLFYCYIDFYEKLFEKYQQLFEFR